ncbi:MAG: OmpA family protein [Chitinophagaceae bacterium]|nr:OmpA family protein [Chitinophagaceae bacterium]
MKFNNKFNKGSRKAWSTYNLLAKGLIVSAFLLTGIQTQVQAQATQYAKPSWYFGAVGAANVNFFDGSTRQLSSEFTPPATFHKGRGVGYYAGGLVQYRPANSVLGIMIQGGYDSRRGKFEQVTTACNCPADLSTNLSYVTLEPSLLLAPFKNGFYIYAGPRMAYNTEKSFTYKEGINPAFPNQAPKADVEGELSNIKKAVISGQVGMGYDIMMGSSSSRTKFVISPFVSYHPYFGQNPRNIETWNLTTIRAGLALKVGAGRAIAAPVTPPIPVAADRDKDGVLDVNDRCPDVYGLASLGGCPDRDGDGIADIDDKCPDIPGVVRYQGCPVPDTDKDGINDETDKCPTVPGLARYQGCPIPDTDGDGVNDEEDKCINEKGPASNFGCPIISEEIIKRVKIAAQNIFFETAKSTLLAKSFPKLNDVVSILKDNPSFKLQIDGHTDFVGNDEYNQTLSEQRAAAVRAFFVSKGIDESRLSSAGYGESRPVADNNTAAGKALNRRVEMTLRNY